MLDRGHNEPNQAKGCMGKERKADARIVHMSMIPAHPTKTHGLKTHACHSCTHCLKCMQIDEDLKQWISPVGGGGGGGGGRSSAGGGAGFIDAASNSRSLLSYCSSNGESGQFHVRRLSSVGL